MPSVRKKKPLYVANSVGELNKHSEQLKTKVVMNTQLECKRYCDAINDVYRKAEAQLMDGDEENAYILFMRFLYIFSILRKTYEYAKRKKVYDDILKGTPIKAIKIAEDLAKSLEKRYLELQEAKQALPEKNVSPSKPGSGLKPPPPSENSKGITDSKTTEIKKERKNNEKNIDDVDIVLPAVPDDDSLENKSVKAVKPPKETKNTVISVTDLYHILKTGDKDSLLIFDVRSASEFSQSRIKTDICVNIPCELLKPGATINSIERRLPKNVWEIWITRSKKEQIIILDSDHKVEDMTINNPARVLKDAIFLWESRNGLKNEPVLLDGGFNNWFIHYPSLTTNPFYKKEKAPLIKESLDALPKFSYPDLPTYDDNTPDTKRSRNSEPSSLGSPPIPASRGSDDVNESQVPMETKTTGISGAPAALSRDHISNKLEEMRKMLEARDKARGNLTDAGIVNPNMDATASVKGNENHVPETFNVRDGKQSTTKGLPSVDGDSKAVLPDGTELNPGNGTGITITTQSQAQPPRGLGASSQANVSSPEKISIPHSIKFMGETVDVSHPIVPQDESKETKPQVQLDKGQISQEYPSSVQGTNITNHPPVRANPMMPHAPLQPATHGVHPSQQAVPLPRPSSQPHNPARPPTNQVTPVPAPRNFPSHHSTHPVPAPRTMPLPGQHSSNLVAPHQTPSLPPSSLDPSFPKPQHHVPSNLAPSHPIVPNQAASQMNQHHTPVPPATAPPSGLPKPGMQSPSQLGHMPLPVSRPPPAVHSSAQHFSATMETPAAIPQAHPSAGTQPSILQLPHAPPVLPSTQSHRSQDLRSYEPGSLTQPMSGPAEHTGKIPARTAIPNSPGLPNGWEKCIDTKTGRVYYKDHVLMTTHWELPPDFRASLQRHPVAKATNQLKPAKIDSSGVDQKSRLKRSLSSPNLADLEEAEKSSVLVPKINRDVKPKQLIDRSTKPMSATRLQNLSPVYGSKGRLLTGLKNLGNTCYMNAVIQCLANSTPLARYLCDGHYLQDLNPNSVNREPGEITKELSFLLKVLWSGQYRSVSPVDLKLAIGRFASQFSGTKQQDSHEFLMFYMDGIHEDVNKVQKRIQMKEQNNDALPDHIAAEKAWTEYRRKNDSVIVDLFQGQFRSTVTCLTCGKKSITFDAFNCLPLQLTSRGSCHLEDCIRSFTSPEKIGGNNSWKCSNCKAYREATKTIEIWKLPPLLIIQLKRFCYDGMWHNKLQMMVNFPVGDFNMRKYIIGNETQHSQFRLYGVVNHYGSFECGHYTAYCENAHHNKWYCYDDNSVKDIERGNVKTSAAYLLFFTAVDLRAYLGK